MLWQGGDDMTDDERIDLPEAVRLLGLSARQVRRYRQRLGARLEVRDVVQPAQEVLTFSRQAVEQFRAEREGRSAPEM